MKLNYLDRKYSLGAITAAVALALLVPATGSPASPEPGSPAPTVRLREDFNSLDRWRPLKFKRIDNMCTYTLVPLADGGNAVKAQSSNAASGMVWLDTFDVYEYPMIRWRWKISNVYVRGNALDKAGDDYPMRIYILFKYDPADPHVKRKFKYGLGKLLYGQYPPYASLNYIWANREHRQAFLPNPFAKEAMMVPLRSGSGLAGQWLEEERNILADYRAAFGEDPPALAGIAFMNDSDNTGESSESWIDYIEIFRVPEDSQGKEERGKVKDQ